MFRVTMEVLGTRELDFAIDGLLRKLDDFSDLWPKLAALFYQIETAQFAGAGIGRSGPWPALSEKYARWKAIHYGGQPLMVRDDHLRASLTNPGSEGSIREETKDTFTIGTAVPYAIHHQAPERAGRPPRRKVVDFTDEHNVLFAKEFQKYINTDALKSFGAAQRRLPFGERV